MATAGESRFGVLPPCGNFLVWLVREAMGPCASVFVCENALTFCQRFQIPGVDADIVTRDMALSLEGIAEAVLGDSFAAEASVQHFSVRNFLDSDFGEVRTLYAIRDQRRAYLGALES